MEMTPRRFFGLLFLGIWIVGGGCGSSSGPGAPGTEGELSGTVTMQGKPVTFGEVFFEPTGGPAGDTAPRTAMTGADGLYKILLIPGQYRATVRKSQGQKPPSALGEPKPLDVESGPKKFDIAL